MTPIRQRLIQGLEVGDTFEVTRNFTPTEVRQFEALSRDHNPVHSDPVFAAAKGFSGCVCHGLLVASLLTEIGGELAWLASEMNLRFRKPTYPGDAITCTLTLTELDERRRATAQVSFTNQHGEQVLEATLRGVLPGPGEVTA